MEVFDITNPLYNENISPVTLAWHFVKSRFHGTMLCVSHVKPLKYITFLAIPLQARTDTISCMYLCISNTQVLKWGENICGYLFSFCGAFFLRIAGWKNQNPQNFVPHGSCDCVLMASVISSIFPLYKSYKG